jgi:hypothetical protein
MTEYSRLIGVFSSDDTGTITDVSTERNVFIFMVKQATFYDTLIQNMKALCYFKTSVFICRNVVTFQTVVCQLSRFK